MTTNENLESKPNLRLITPATSDNQAFPENPVGLSIWAMIAALGTYFCMYGFRKPFTAGTYEEIDRKSTRLNSSHRP